VKRLLWLLPFLLVGCTGAEGVALIGALGGAYMGYKKITHPVAGAIAADPGAFWSVLAQIVGLITLIVTVALKAGNSKGKPKGGK